MSEINSNLSEIKDTCQKLKKYSKNLLGKSFSLNVKFLEKIRNLNSSCRARAEVRQTIFPVVKKQKPSMKFGNFIDSMNDITWWG